ncbi:relaxase/mobilization nuclease domain-containing protein [Ruminococcus albus]|uniref:Relaxase/mobilization nuclease family protein n=1 Tax=Ruminococcus albus (strain ATCC 27210 / DSM 20455 / JCM 14654 / NCDO 2250 / 7) TaxID=697329 RepID=E6UCL9_RUMA7|nr:relaxase/mobilization nuclease domain-containing protein [Ruminococcus albus]ADU21624.1 Relaxase/mobilization nuclease family protein [Ruminococcus albus 7 = DSM 20455]
MPFGNVNVDYAPCKSVGALKAAADYMLGQKKEQIESGVKKTSEGLYTALGCNRENFANGILVTRKLNGKSYSKHKANTILAHKMSISFHPLDNVDNKTAFEIAQDFAEHFIHSKGYEVLFAVHTDTDHIHAHFLISNCNMENGKSYRRSQHDLYEMSKYFGQKCLEHGFTHSVRDSFYNHDMSRQKDKLTFGEAQMKKRGAESFKDELREVIRIELADPNNRTFDDVIRSLKEHYNVECRVVGNTVSYKHPQYLDKNGKSVSVRGSRLGDLYTRKGIEYELTKKCREYSTAGAFRAVGERYETESRGTSDGRGQVPDRTAARNSRQDVHGLDGFYERYTDRAAEDERESAAAVGHSGAVSPKRKKRRR